MKFPVLVCSGSRVLVFDESLVNDIGSLKGDELHVAVNHEGRCEFRWILDGDGLFYGLSLQGLAKRTFFQYVGLRRRRAVLKVDHPKRMTAGQLVVEINGLKDHDPDCPNVGQLREALQQMDEREIWTGDHMKKYMGE